MKAILFALIVALLMVGCGEEQPAEHDTNAILTAYAELEFEHTEKLAVGGDKVAQFNLGIMYDHGKGVSEDDKEAVKWYRKSAEQGYAIAQNNLGSKYYNGEGVTQDFKEAVKWYAKSAEQGDAMAQNSLGGMYDTGKGVSEDDKEAIKWYIKSAE